MAMSTQEEREIKVHIVSNFCRRANNSDYSLEDILAMDDDMLDVYITMNDLGGKCGAEVLEAVHSASILTPATARNRVGPLPADSPIVGGGVRAHGGPLQRRGASCSCRTPAGRAGTQVQDQSCPG